MQLYFITLIQKKNNLKAKIKSGNNLMDYFKTF